MVPVASSAATGAAGGVMSGARALVGMETLPAVSVSVALTVPPLAWAGVSGTLKLPSAPTWPVPMTVPLASRRVTMAPTSPLPVALAPVPSSAKTGASGAVRSGAVAGLGGEVLPAASACVT